MGDADEKGNGPGADEKGNGPGDEGTQGAGMTDGQQPDERVDVPPPADAGMPVAGRKPTSEAPDDEAPDDDEALKDRSAGVGDGPTVPLKRPAPAPDDEPTTRLNADTPSPEPVTETVKEPEPEESDEPEEKDEPKGKAPWKRLSSAGALIWVLLALFGFTLVVQLRSNNTDEGLASARQEDLVRILSDLEARDTRLQAEITALENSQRQLTSGVAGRTAALAEADRRAQELGLLAGTLPGRGPGLHISIDRVKASAILNAVQELRGAGGEVMQLAGSNGNAVRVVASTYFVDADGGGIVADKVRLTGPYTLSVIGQPQTMETALQIPGGVVASVKSDGGSVTMEQRQVVDVTAIREATSLQYARPAS